MKYGDRRDRFPLASRTLCGSRGRMDRRAAQIIPGRMRLCLRFWDGELAGIRTQDPRLKRALLYLLSYELVLDRFIQIITRAALMPQRSTLVSLPEAEGGCAKAKFRLPYQRPDSN